MVLGEQLWRGRGRVIGVGVTGGWQLGDRGRGRSGDRLLGGGSFWRERTMPTKR